MKKLIILILSLCVCISASGFSETYLSDFFEVTNDESIQQEFIIDKKIRDRAQVIAKQYAKRGLTQTNIVTFETLDSGVNVHIGWYQDGFIVTALDGTEAGKQVIFINDIVVGISYDVKVYKKYFEHKYTWANVKSYPNKQLLKSKK